MTLFETIQNKLQEARQNQDSEKTKFWSFLFSEIKSIEKKKVSEKERESGATELSDKNILEVLRKLIKNYSMTIEQAKEYNRVKDAEKAENELKLLTEIIPENEREIDKETLQKIIIEIIENSGEEKSPKLIGKVMKQLKENYGNQIDGKLASSLVKSILQN